MHTVDIYAVWPCSQTWYTEIQSFYCWGNILSPNTMSNPQFMDQGVIKTFKSYHTWNVHLCSIKVTDYGASDNLKAVYAGPFHFVRVRSCYCACTESISLDINGRPCGCIDISPFTHNVLNFLTSIYPNTPFLRNSIHTLDESYCNLLLFQPYDFLNLVVGQDLQSSL
jgi:hypothetical protein